ncbi:MAG: 30S ribosomal protein S6 [Sandaracinaceae bacterium]
MSTATQLYREYELIYILRPNATTAEGTKVFDRVGEILERFGARLTKVDNWGKRRLAYPIKKLTRGVFVLLKFVGPGDVVAEIERNLRNLDEVIRYQTIRLEEVYDLATLQVDPEEVQLREIEEGDDDDQEPSFEERLGLTPQAPRRSDRGASQDRRSDGESSRDDDEEGGDSDDGGDAKDSDDSGGQAKAEAGGEGDDGDKA